MPMNKKPISLPKYILQDPVGKYSTCVKRAAVNVAAKSWADTGSVYKLYKPAALWRAVRGWVGRHSEQRKGVGFFHPPEEMNSA